MKPGSILPLLMMSAGLVACGGSSSDPVAPHDPATPSADNGKMHYVQSELKMPGLRANIVKLQNMCADLRDMQGLPASPKISIDQVDPRIEILTQDKYVASDRMALYKRGYEYTPMSETCALGSLIDTVEFESSFADGRMISWSRSGGNYKDRVVDTQDVAGLKALVGSLMNQGGISLPISQDDLSKIRVATGNKFWFDSVGCNEYEFPAQGMKICETQVSDPVPMMGAAGQDNLTLSVKIVPPGSTPGDLSTVDSEATKVQLSRALDPSVFDPTSL